VLNEWECYFVCKGWALIIQRECFWWTRSICSFILLLRFIILLWFHSFIRWNFECVFFKQIITVWNFCCYKETNGVNRLSSLMQRSKVVIAAFFVCRKVLRILSSSLIKHTYTQREREREREGRMERDTSSSLYLLRVFVWLKHRMFFCILMMKMTRNTKFGAPFEFHERKRSLRSWLCCVEYHVDNTEVDKEDTQIFWSAIEWYIL
jgi:hypothetical protein